MPYSISNLSGKTVVITGASSGIGLACAKKFADFGCKLILIARDLQRLQAQTQGFASQCQTFALDVRDASAVELWCSQITAIDILINNAGLARGWEKTHEGSITDWNEMIDTNMKGLLYMTKFLVPKMLHANSGHVIQIGSTAGQWSYPHGAVYCGTKAAVRSITEALRMELVDTPIRVSNIQPGLCETDFSLIRFHGDENRAKQVYAGIEALQPEDVADAVVYVASAPAHVQIAELTLMPTTQATSMVIHRKT